jgi:FkbM family methyltransferase
VEPFADTFEICQKNLAPYSGRVTALKGAIWSHGGRVSLDPHPEEWANQVKAPDGSETGSAEAFTMTSLIAEAGGFVDLLKLDVEGSEKEIFGSGADEWLPFVRNIVIELHGPDCFERFFAALAPYEYELSNQDMVYCCRNLRPRKGS